MDALLLLLLLYISLESVCANPPTAGGPALVTFIIPTVGRPTLAATLASLRAQTDGRWLAVVVNDGGKTTLPPPHEGDLRIRLRHLQHRVAVKDCAGAVRNAGMALARTPWVAFVDDDDTLSPMYVRLLAEEAQRDAAADVIIFRMHKPGNGRRPPVLPPLDASDIHGGYVGISFAVKRNASDPDRHFVPSMAEDFEFLHRLCHFRLRCIIAPYVTCPARPRAPPGSMSRPGTHSHSGVHSDHRTTSEDGPTQQEGGGAPAKWGQSPSGGRGCRHFVHGERAPLEQGQRAVVPPWPGGREGEEQERLLRSRLRKARRHCYG